jgi:predicted DNA-binding protein (UPF0251 family)
MARPRCTRDTGFLSQITYFKIVGVRMADLEEVILQHDELGAMRLKDQPGETQEEVARRMNVSEPTFHRLLPSAHEKIPMPSSIARHRGLKAVMLLLRKGLLHHMACATCMGMDGRKNPDCSKVMCNQL